MFAAAASAAAPAAAAASAASRDIGSSFAAVAYRRSQRRRHRVDADDRSTAPPVYASSSAAMAMATDIVTALQHHDFAGREQAFVALLDRLTHRCQEQKAHLSRLTLSCMSMDRTLQTLLGSTHALVDDIALIQRQLNETTKNLCDRDREREREREHEVFTSDEDNMSLCDATKDNMPRLRPHLMLMESPPRLDNSVNSDDDDDDDDDEPPLPVPSAPQRWKPTMPHLDPEKIKGMVEQMPDGTFLLRVFPCKTRTSLSDITSVFSRFGVFASAVKGYTVTDGVYKGRRGMSVAYTTAASCRWALDALRHCGVPPFVPAQQVIFDTYTNDYYLVHPDREH